MSIGLKANSDGSGAVQIGGSDAITISTGLNTTFAGTVAAGNITSSGTVSSATGAIYPLISGTAVASTSGTAIDFVGIPSTAKRITVMFNGVSTSGTSNVIVQLGTGATPTYTTSGYLGSGSVSPAFSSGFIFWANLGATDIAYGAMTISNFSGNTWLETSCLGIPAATNTRTSGGIVPLAAALTAIRVTMVNGTDTFDAGSINILYE